MPLLCFSPRYTLTSVDMAYCFHYFMWVQRVGILSEKSSHGSVLQVINLTKMIENHQTWGCSLLAFLQGLQVGIVEDVEYRVYICRWRAQFVYSAVCCEIFKRVAVLFYDGILNWNHCSMITFSCRSGQIWRTCVLLHLIVDLFLSFTPKYNTSICNRHSKFEVIEPLCDFLSVVIWSNHRSEAIRT